MAKKKINRSQVIRDYAQANPDDKPKAIAAALKGKGIKLSAQYVSTVLSNSKKRGGKKRGRKAGLNGAAVGLEELMLAKDLVQRVGLESAKKAIESYGKLMA